MEVTVLLLQHHRDLSWPYFRHLWFVVLLCWQHRFLYFFYLLTTIHFCCCWRFFSVFVVGGTSSFSYFPFSVFGLVLVVRAILFLEWKYFPERQKSSGKCQENAKTLKKNFKKVTHSPLPSALTFQLSRIMNRYSSLWCTSRASNQWWIAHLLRFKGF